ncbi:Ankyrin repeat-containing protein BDA1 [Camellia lanceoleosa]|uniref:Ankyrin repeat-containing protein BDA1 n=1 Tax=Camellia lanceoleosa TaxID=1840588 RepID=A0ACC0G313_9ERIC|nr:Ankyrin repeat-containing protein BDA1 [Camellia lanceoleosa]
MDRTIRDETALHIAVKNSKPEAFKVLLGWLRRSQNKNLLNSKDDTGNTVLHIAVSNSQTEIVKLLAEESYTKKNAKNLDGLTALDIAARPESEREIEVILRRAGALESSSSPTDYSLADFLKSPERMIEKIIKQIFDLLDFFSMSMETRNVILVVAVLVATTTFQAILSPPGGSRGLGSDNNNQPNGILMNATIISTTSLPTNISHFNVAVFTTPSNTNTTHNPANQVRYHDASSNSDFSYGTFFSLFYFYNTCRSVQILSSRYFSCQAHTFKGNALRC